MKKYSRVLAGILAVLLSAGCTGLMQQLSQTALPLPTALPQQQRTNQIKKIQKIQRKLISLTVIQKSRLRKKQFMLSLTLPATRQNSRFQLAEKPTGRKEAGGRFRPDRYREC